jgi:hypothetical protein
MVSHRHARKQSKARCALTGDHLALAASSGEKVCAARLKPTELQFFALTLTGQTASLDGLMNDPLTNGSGQPLKEVMQL